MEHLEELNEIDDQLEKLQQIKEEFSHYANNDSSQHAKLELANAITDITRRRNAFNSKRFFIVTFGMLKAGKSTLVNTFVGRKISPIGSSQETTLRCAIILAADDTNAEGIYHYEPKGEPCDKIALEKWREGKCVALFDYLNGLENEDFLKANFNVRKEVYSSDAVKKYLSNPENRDRFDLPPVIRIDTRKFPDSEDMPYVREINLLRDGVAIIDTPGLDGALANSENDPFFRILPSNGDFFLLVQSSMSAINKSGAETIKKIYGATGNLPIVVVFNEMNSRFWLKFQEQHDALKTDAKKASDDLASKLDMGGRRPKYLSINAGQAYDAIFTSKPSSFVQERQDMIAQSRLPDLKAEIQRIIRDERESIKLHNSIKRMNESLSKAITDLHAAKGTLVARKEEYEKTVSSKKDGLQEIIERLTVFANTDIDAISKTSKECLIQYFKAKMSGEIDNAIDSSHLNAWKPEVSRFVRKGPLGMGGKEEKTVANKAHHDGDLVKDRFDGCAKTVDVAFNRIIRELLDMSFDQKAVEPWSNIQEVEKARFDQIARILEKMRTLVDTDKDCDEGSFLKKLFFSISVKPEEEQPGKMVPINVEQFRPSDPFQPTVPLHGVVKKYGVECELVNAVKKMKTDMEDHYRLGITTASASIKDCIRTEGKKYISDRIALCRNTIRSIDCKCQAEINILEGEIACLDKALACITRVKDISARL